ncbi:hypothetical protein GF402_05260 [Candidatus Fermentibacteria bacterium]|nr:hypothetical protein [Candidatus Fermentibacteria bacterium]
MGPIIVVFNAVFDVLTYPFSGLQPLWGLCFVSVICGIGLIILFRAASPQEAIARIRRRMGSQALGMLLFMDNPSNVIRLAGGLLWSNFRYLALVVKPLLVIAIPFMVVYSQLEARYSRAPLGAGQTTTVTVEFEDLPARDDLEVASLSGLDLIRPFVFVDTLRQVSFRAVVTGGPPRALSVMGSRLTVGRSREGAGAVHRWEYDDSWSVLSLLKPWVERVRGDSPRSPVGGAVVLPDARYHVLGGRWSWLAVFLVVSSATGVVGAFVLKVKI